MSEYHSTSRKINIVIIPVLVTLFISLFVPTNINESKIHGLRIGFVENTFTNAAYNNAFYHFYPKYDLIPQGVNVTSDLQDLTAHIPPPSMDKTHVHLVYLIKHLRPILFNSTMTIIRDEDVHNGRVFLDNGNNAFDILVLGQQEYVTQQEYNNLKHFVSNGGTILFINGNFLYAEVRYNQAKNTVTLVKGHGWEFDGEAARKGVPERWFNETREWVGSNYWYKVGIHSNVTFTNNPFNYEHFEEQYVNNPKDKIIVDYGAISRDTKNYRTTPTIATYELNYGKGKVIVLGIYAFQLLDNDLFIKFLGNLILERPIKKEFCPPGHPQTQGINLIDEKHVWKTVNNVKLTKICGNVLVIHTYIVHPYKVFNRAVLPMQINSTDNTSINLTLDYTSESLTGNATFLAEIRDNKSKEILWSDYLNNTGGKLTNQRFTLPSNILNKPVEFRLYTVTAGPGEHVLKVVKANITF